MPSATADKNMPGSLNAEDGKLLQTPEQKKDYGTAEPEVRFD